MDILKIFDYDAYANEKVWQALKSAEYISDQRIISLFNHIIGAHHIWLSRIDELEPRLEIWPALSFPEMISYLEQNHERTVTMIRAGRLYETTSYKNSKGKAFQNSVEDILYHVANHSNYHRGQMATRMREAGLEPVETNFIIYKRE